MTNTQKNPLIHDLRDYMNKRIIGQANFVDRLLLALFADGHILLEGAPGLAKTKAVNTLASKIKCDARSIQFTPDLLPSDLTGTDIFRPEQGTFTFQSGPLFHNLVLADEINRAPAKVQSALLEAMAERQVTVGGKTYPLPPLFMVLATQNPIEQEGTYPLPEAQLDRFLLQVNIDYPSAEAEREILKLVHNEAIGKAEENTSMIAIEDIFTARQEALQTHVSESLIEYIIQLIQATRYPEKYGDDLAGMIDFGASPRATIALERCARVYAWMRGSEFATPQDVQAIAHDVLRHRILLSFEAEADGVTTDQLIDKLIARVPVI
ncbi:MULTISPECIES: AAA family ATPase [Pasteurellaceae]|uniref:MoxR family ATPase n=1 Tax=Pasteurella atlantica TaxID=2827233 RepID=A0AAW8CMI7_9PAST|nr:MoxR family ATPase [Pasteurella atlantica]MBR0572630.1 MoxR family ATPase [Pasteurella atlantica]MDP8038576.1 MoxR family ATPase [Pasteurella atlantica]MDP8040668.1 MoxR family ATPase [Pasteurella atlantica]MDP8042803.1 MoxR family ATPase [Pasteurella atlantica]MDP8044890.1 MoxR family ATPase [Pasteurella atlantica]